MDGELRGIFQAYLPNIFWQSIETWSTGKGVPDLYFATKRRAGWIECKVTTANAVGILPEQIGWAEKHARFGGRSFLAVRKLAKRGKRREPCDELHLFSAAGIRHCKDHGLTGVPVQFQLGQWSGGPVGWDWKAIKRLLES